MLGANASETETVCAGDVHKTRRSLMLAFLLCSAASISQWPGHDPQRCTRRVEACRCRTVGAVEGRLILMLLARQILAPWRSPRRGSGSKGEGPWGAKMCFMRFQEELPPGEARSKAGHNLGAKNETKIGLKKRDQKWTPWWPLQ